MKETGDQGESASIKVTSVSVIEISKAQATKCQ